MAAGRPLKYKTSKELETGIQSYFDELGQKHPTITGLALHLGFTSRQAIMNYQERPEFVDAIKRAKLTIEAHYEQQLFAKTPAGAIFALKNFGWSDKHEIEQTTRIIEFVD